MDQTQDFYLGDWGLHPVVGEVLLIIFRLS